ncbi:glycosyltransferase [Zunongwangia sp. H14]|uniref:glycosyltransferase n=1 Tax=Zunongwangia sp. H14 TaxID=3240792 RepID=UPI0035612A99
MIEILNIPNYYSSYYLYGFFKNFRVRFINEKEFQKFHNKPVLIFRWNTKMGVIDNDDPQQVNEELYKLADIYFATNKLLENDSYQRHKVVALYPHYPINCLSAYLQIFKLNWFKYVNLKAVLQQINTLRQRPLYRNFNFRENHGNFVFFASRLWKKESETNLIRAKFIRACKENEKIDFEGGFMARSDGETYDYEGELSSKYYGPKKFSKLSAMSLFSLNNPAVCGAVSWRLAEYFNKGILVLAYPFKIELPTIPEHEKEIYYVSDTKDFPALIDKALKDPAWRNLLAKQGKTYFDKYCTPSAQINYILQNMNNLQQNS